MHDYSKLSGKKRLRFKDWLIERLDNGKIRGVEWIDRERGLFKIPWMHGSHKNWNATDVEIFRQWAIYSGKYNPTADQRSDPIKWKTNFRCTLNALHDFKEIEVREEHSPRGPKRYKIYSLKSSSKSKKGLNALGKVEKRTDAFDLTDKEIIQMVDEMMTPGPITRPVLQKPSLFTQARPNATYPAFETLVLGKSKETFPSSYTPWFLSAWNAMAVDLYVEKPEEEKTAEESVDAKNSTEGRAEDSE